MTSTEKFTKHRKERRLKRSGGPFKVGDLESEKLSNGEASAVYNSTIVFELGRKASKKDKPPSVSERGVGFLFFGRFLGDLSIML